MPLLFASAVILLSAVAFAVLGKANRKTETSSPSTFNGWESMCPDVACVLLSSRPRTFSAESAVLACTNWHWRRIVQQWRNYATNHTDVTFQQSARVDDSVLLAVARDAPMLRRLDLTVCSQVGGESLDAVGRGCPLLEELRLPASVSSASRFWSRRHPTPIEEGALVRLAHSCPRLKLLRGACGSFGDDALKALSQCPCLCELKIAPCISVEVTDAGLAALGRACHELRLLDVTGGRFSRRERSVFAVTDAGIHALASGCPALTNLNLGIYSDLTDGAIQSLASHCHCIAELDVMGCCRLTDLSLQLLGQHCGTRLRGLNLPCELITQRGIDTLTRTHAPQLVDLGMGLLIYDDPEHDHGYAHTH